MEASDDDIVRLVGLLIERCVIKFTAGGRSVRALPKTSRLYQPVLPVWREIPTAQAGGASAAQGDASSNARWQHPVATKLCAPRTTNADASASTSASSSSISTASTLVVPTLASALYELFDVVAEKKQIWTAVESLAHKTLPWNGRREKQIFFVARKRDLYASAELPAPNEQWVRWSSSAAAQALYVLNLSAKTEREKYMEYDNHTDAVFWTLKVSKFLNDFAERLVGA